MSAVDLRPVPEDARTQSPLDVFLFFAGANLVATTILTGSSLVPAFGTREAVALVVGGSAAGSALVAVLATVGSRLGTPSVIAARAALGRHGGALLALLLYLTNFAWIALNNIIAASACVRAVGGPPLLWNLGLGVLATAVVARGPRATALANRLAVPLMGLVGVLLLFRLADLPPAVLEAPGTGGMGLVRGLDVVIGYEVAWILIFADYSRFTRSPRGAALGVFGGLFVSSLWFMGMGVLGGHLAGTADPSAITDAFGLGAVGCALLAVATVTTNFVNVYVSALAWKSLRPSTPDVPSVWVIGGVGTALGLLSQVWLDHYVDLMVGLAGLLVPVGGVLVSRLLLGAPVDVRALYDEAGPAWRAPGMLGWIAGGAVYVAFSGSGATLPALLTALAVHAVLERLSAARATARARA